MPKAESSSPYSGSAPLRRSFGKTRIHIAPNVTPMAGAMWQHATSVVTGPSMIHFSDDMVDRHVEPSAALDVMRRAFLSFGQGRAAMQERIRTDAGGIKLSTLGAVIPDLEVAGAKVYTTIAGQFSFVIVLFSAVDGRPLATFDAGAITRLRTAACSTLAASFLARKGSEILALFGAGTQGVAHACQLTETLGLKRILLCDPFSAPDAAQQLALRCRVPVEISTSDAAVAQADIVVTASRSTIPLFHGQSLKKGAFVAAIGSSLPYTRELDDVAIARATKVVVEWRTQALKEAGDLVLVDQLLLPSQKVLELAEVIAGTNQVRLTDDDIVIYKAVGVGLEDVALAGFAYQRMVATQDSST